MTNATRNATAPLESKPETDPDEVFQIVWLVGISVSLVGLALKISFFILIPKCRNFDEEVLLQLTIARTLNTICEYCIMYVRSSNVIKDIIYTMYMQTDLVLVLWMFVFSKNLYNKVVYVFPVEKPNLVVMSGLIWIISLPVGLICPSLLKLKHNVYFNIYYKVYAHIKLFVIVVNALIFFKIFSVAIRKGKSNAHSVKHYVKTAIIAFILICITSLQVLVTDILSFYYYSYTMLVKIFCVINSFQVIAISVIFVSLVNSKRNESAFRTISIQLKELVGQSANV
ncbi:unnamed protein product [Parnassius mnemosyne]|uniref:Taste receptor type 2 n=1 Tax=Parnassius mnemosyne TaxID=213953 RepID=A0AAV1KKT9_9NEOP